MPATNTRRHAVAIVLASCLSLANLLLAACLPATRPAFKIALVAPFEGRYRNVGYEVIYAVRLAIRETNAAGGVVGHTVELVALDDGGSPASAIEQAHKVISDPQVMGVIGHWLEDTTTSAAGVYHLAGLPHLATSAGPLPDSTFRVWAPERVLYAPAAESGAGACVYTCDIEAAEAWLQSHTSETSGPIFGPPIWAQNEFRALLGQKAEGVYVQLPAPLPSDSTDPEFASRYRSISNGIEPGANAVLAYDAARLLLAAVADDIAAHGRPTGTGVAQALEAAEFGGLSGPMGFDRDRDWSHVRIWVYQWRDGRLATP
jgi:ABC-type branched-subunit amino acid transport system substrate-binding protein